MTPRRLTYDEIELYAYGERDELEEVILADPQYLATLEDIWAEEMPRDLRAPILRALQFEQFVSGVAGATLDLTFRFGEAMSHYIEVSIEDAPES